MRSQTMCKVADTVIDHMLVTEYDDGATSGFIQCSACSSLYRFITLDWSRSRSIRVIALSRVPSDSTSKLRSFFSEIPPHGLSIPKMLQRATDQDLDRIEAFVAVISKQAESPSLVIAWDVRTNAILAARAVDSLSPDHFVSLFDPHGEVDSQRYNWFVDLGIERDG